MTIASVTSRMNYTGNGSTDTYSYTFKIFLEADLLVKEVNTSGVERTLSLTTDYTVTGVGEEAGGTIVLVAGNLTSGYLLSIRRVVELTQETDIRNQGEFFPEIHEDEFDKLTMIDQQQQDQLDRSITIPETVSSFSVELPADVASHPGSAVVVNDTGTGFILGIDNNGTDPSRISRTGDTMTGDLLFATQFGVKLEDADSSNYIRLKAPAVVPANYDVIFPAAVPTAQKVLKYDGANYVWDIPNGPVASKSANYTVLDTDGFSLIKVTTGASNVTIGLPAAANNVGRIICVKKIDSGAGLAILDGNASETIDGALVLNLYSQYSQATVQSDGTSWSAISRPISPWVTSAFVINSFGTLTLSSLWQRQVGDTMHFRGTAKAGTVAAATASISLPTGYVIDSSKLPSTAAFRVGFLSQVRTAVGPTNDTTAFEVFYDGSDTAKVYVTFQSGSNVFTKVNASAVINSSDSMSIEFSVPVL